MMSPHSVAAIGDDEFDEFLTFLETPTTKNVRKTTRDVDVPALPFRTKQLSTKGDGDFDKFLSFLENPTPTKETEVSEDSIDDFLAHLKTSAGEGSVVSKETEVSGKSEDSIDDFLAYLNGGDVPPPRPAEATPARRGKREKSKPPKPSSLDKNLALPIDYFVVEGQKEVEARNKALRELSESVRPIAVTYFTKLAEDNASKHAALMRELSEESMPAATKYFNKLASEGKMSAGAKGGEVELMPAAIAYFTLAQREVASAKREIAELRANPPPMPPGQEYFTMKDREMKARKAAEIQDMIDNPPPAPVAQEYFTRIAEERKLQLMREAEEPREAAIEYFTNKAKEEKSKRDLMLRELRENPAPASVATQHFNERAARMEEARKRRPVQVGSYVSPEPVPMDYFVKLYKEEKEAKALEARMLIESNMPLATAHFTDLGKKKSQRTRSLDIESMPVATAYFAKLDAEKKASSVKEAQETEYLPMAIQVFTQAAREEKLKKMASVSDGLEPIPVAMLHFTPGLSERIQVAE